MRSYDTAAAIAAAPSDASVDPALRPVLQERVRDWAEAGLLHLTHLLIVEAGDTEAAIIREVGFTPLASPLDRARFGSPEFHLFWDGLWRHDGWFELVVTVGNSGFAYVLLIRDAEGTDPELLNLCRTQADR